ncbi:MAG: TetR/AcrR family transcriptional regulator [Proteobacteria bacterium]|nr:TetR/AcrR family transcriptional regulator [Pseudomonadota bacterium]MBU1420569.1 TetR/AcrR family transcriptional regulator [Pseudomonadota bacterium]MBU1456716.1 TetR/AcrR family transcriptional regulator [Pseudomonadota bacterium]
MKESNHSTATKENIRQKRTREKVINLAMHVLAKNPKASLNEIAEAAEVGRATLFRYFKSRKQLIHELVVEADKKLENATKPIVEKNLNARDTLEEFIKVLVPLGASFHFLNSEQIQSEGSGIEDLYRNQLVRLKELSKRLQAEKVVAANIPLVWIAVVLDNLIYAAWVTVLEGDIAPNDAPGLVLYSFLNGLSPL